MDIVEKHIEITVLLDFYTPLLTEKQAKVMRYYFEENYTLAEIAELEGISRNAVHDNIQKTIRKLHDYEKKLALHEKTVKRQSIVEKLRQVCDNEEAIRLLNELEKVD